MGRSAGGNYSLANGNPVQTNTIISSSWANSTLTDIASALTDSLSRDGLGGMRQPLKIVDGISGAPGLTFGEEESTGLYRIDAGIVGLSLLGNTYLTAGDGDVATNYVLRGTKGLTITQSTTNTAGATITGNGTGNGITVTGGSSSGTGLSVTAGAGNGVGASISGTGSGTGLNATGGATGWGINATGAIGLVATGTNGGGVTAIGSAGEAGLKAIAGTAASATTAQTAIFCEKGYLTFTGASAGAAVNPNGNVGFNNTLTPLNLPKAWVRFQTTGGGSTETTVSASFNVDSVTVSGTIITVTLTTALAGTGAAWVTPGLSSNDLSCEAVCSGSTCTIEAKQLEISGTPFDLYNFQSGGAKNLQVMIFGAQ